MNSQESLSSDYNLCETRLNSLYSRLKKEPNLLFEYDSSIRDQPKAEIIEPVPISEKTNSKVYFIADHCVVRKKRETSKVRIVFDGSAKSPNQAYSLNDHLENGPNFIPPFFDMLIKFRSKPIGIVSDITKVFIQISVDPDDRNLLRLSFYEKEEPEVIKLLKNLYVDYFANSINAVEQGYRAYTTVKDIMAKGGFQNGTQIVKHYLS